MERRMTQCECHCNGDFLFHLRSEPKFPVLFLGQLEPQAAAPDIDAMLEFAQLDLGHRRDALDHGAHGAFILKRDFTGEAKSCNQLQS